MGDPPALCFSCTGDHGNTCWEADSINLDTWMTVSRRPLLSWSVCGKYNLVVLSHGYLELFVTAAWPALYWLKKGRHSLSEGIKAEQAESEGEKWHFWIWEAWTVVEYYRKRKSDSRDYWPWVQCHLRHLLSERLQAKAPSLSHLSFPRYEWRRVEITTSWSLPLGWLQLISYVEPSQLPGSTQSLGSIPQTMIITLGRWSKESWLFKLWEIRHCS